MALTFAMRLPACVGVYWDEERTTIYSTDPEATREVALPGVFVCEVKV